MLTLPPALSEAGLGVGVQLEICALKRLNLRRIGDSSLSSIRAFSFPRAAASVSSRLPSSLRRVPDQEIPSRLRDRTVPARPAAGRTGSVSRAPSPQMPGSEVPLREPRAPPAGCPPTSIAIAPNRLTSAVRIRGQPAPPEDRPPSSSAGVRLPPCGSFTPAQRGSGGSSCGVSFTAPSSASRSMTTATAARRSAPRMVEAGR